MIRFTHGSCRLKSAPESDASAYTSSAASCSQQRSGLLVGFLAFAGVLEVSLPRHWQVCWTGRAQLLTRYLMSINGHQHHAPSLIEMFPHTGPSRNISLHDRAPQTRSSGVGGLPSGQVVRSLKRFRVASSKAFCGIYLRTLVVQLEEALMSVRSLRRARS